LTAPYLSADQLHILARACRYNRLVPPSKLFKLAHLRVPDVEKLYDEGLLARRDGKYGPNPKTRVALEEHGYDLSKLPVEEVEPRKPSETAERAKLAEAIQNTPMADALGGDQKRLNAFALEVARGKCREGNPFPLVRMQWPKLVIKDPVDLHFFKKYCKRDHDLDLRLDDKQCHLLKMVFSKRNKEVAIKGCTSPGKGLAAALAINLWYDVYVEDRIILVSPTSDHAKTIMFAEVSTWRKEMRHQDKEVEFLTEGAKDSRNSKHIIQILNPESGEGVSGAHGAHTMYVFDEGSRIPDELINNARSPARMILAISNPRTLSGWFHDLFPSVDKDVDAEFVDRAIPRATITFGGLDCINVRAKRLNNTAISPPGGINIELLDGTFYFVPEGIEIPKEYEKYVRPLIPKQLDYAKYNSFLQLKDQNEVDWRADGKFPKEDIQNQVVPPSWLSEPKRLWIEFKDAIVVTAFGLDLAASADGDKTVLAFGGWKGIKGLELGNKCSTLETIQWLRDCCGRIGTDIFTGEYPVAIDAIGAGGMRFCEALAALNVMVLPVIGNSSSESNPNLYMNMRAQLYGEFGLRLSPEANELDTFMVVNDNLLHEELEAHEKIFAPDGIKFNLTPKSPSTRVLHGVKLKSVKEKIKRSPDRADAVVLCYYAIQQSAEALRVYDQFDPSRVAVSKRNVNDKEVFVTADGKEIAEPSDFMDIDAERKLFEEMLVGMRSGTSEFAWPS